jgi:hypothetical protein
MKIIKSVLVIAALGAAQAQGAVYNVTGSLAGVNTVGATSDPTLWVHAGTTAYSTAASNWPAFAGTWNINTSGSSGTVTGQFGDFEQYSTSIKALFLTAVVNQPNLVYSFNGGTVNYNAGTRTLTLGQALPFPATDGGANNNAASDASLLLDTANGALAGVCTGASLICDGQAAQFIAKPNLERFYMTLTFSSDFSGFVGTAVGADVGGNIPAGKTGNTWYKYNFSGTAVAPEVPVPAAAWLFGSGLLGLAGVARRRRNP